MGMSIILAARETDHPIPFTPPPFANRYPDDSTFTSNTQDAFACIRSHTPATNGDNLWWVELGDEGNSIHDTDKIRPELLAAIYGVWDHIKNHGDHGMENWELEWVGALPGKRKSRRYEGDVIVTEQDLFAGGNFEDEIAYGGWGLDDHNPFGMRKNEGACHASRIIPLKEIYGLPLRALYSKNIKNLMFAGRNICVTHVALSSTRVMATCALLGQAAGTAAAVALLHNCTPREVATLHVQKVQKLLMDDGVFLPHVKRQTSALALSAKLNVSEQDRKILFNGIEQPRTSADENKITQKIGDSLIFEFPSPTHVGTLRLMFDRDFSRESVTPNKKMQVFTMKLHTGKDFMPVRDACTTVKGYAVIVDGKEIFREEKNFYSLRQIPINLTAKKIEIKYLSTNGCKNVHLYSADFI